MQYDSIVIHYSEIGIKGNNREFFERKLIENLNSILKGLVKSVNWMYGRIVCELHEKTNNENFSKILKILSCTPGIASYVIAKKTELDIDTMKNISLKIAEEELEKIKEEDSKKKYQKGTISFKIDTKRSNKHFEKNSTEINVIIADNIHDTFNEKYNLTINLKKPDLCITVEICEKISFIYSNKIEGIGGLPVGTSGKIISSISGGIDSPVSSFMMMRRGCKVTFVHAFNKTIAGDGVKSKLQDLVKNLTRFQIHSKLYIVPFVNVQKKVIANIPARYRMIIYRRFMMKIINRIAKKEHAKAVVTGDSVGQVASQTLDNINCIYDAAEIPIFNPLIGMNKEEIVSIAKKIDTYEISIIPYPDCCSFMNAKSPETNGDLREIKKLEEAMGSEDEITELIESCIKESEILTFEFDNDLI